MKTTILLCAIFTVLAFSCTNSNQQDEPNAFISGEIQNPVKPYMLCKSSSGMDTAFLNSNNQFKFSLKLDKAEYITLFNGTNNLDFFIKPQQNIHTKFDIQNIAQSLKVEGETVAENEYLSKKLHMFLDHAIPAEHLYDRPVSEFRRLVDSIYVVEKIILDEHIKQHPNLSPSFIKYEKASLLYDRANKLIEYPRMSSYAKTLNESKYYKFLSKLDFTNDSLLVVYEYRQFLSAYVEFKMHKKVFSEEIREVYPHEATLARLQIISKEFSNENIKNQLLFNALQKHIKYYGYKNTELLFKTFELQCSNSEFKQKLLEPYSTYKELGQGKKAELISFSDVQGNTFDFSNFSGSYIYIDVWASWCLPCRKEAPHFEKLKQEFEHKNIAFISLSVDKNHKDWMNYLHAKSLENNQFWVSNADKFLNAFMIKTIPHFLIIDPDGNIFDINAPRPSENKRSWLKKLPEKAKV